jgi:hypothetical protein
MTTAADSRFEGLHNRTDGPVHLWFSLSYANFLVWHRSHMQSMPLEWQQRFVDLAEELDAAYRDQPAAPGFDVTPVEWTAVSELTDDQMRQLGVTTGDDEDGEWDGVSDREWRERVYYLKGGQEVQGYHEVAIPAADPVPHYNRGRTYLTPDEDAIAALRRSRSEMAQESP